MRHLGIVVAIPAEVRSLTRQRVSFGRRIILGEGVSVYLAGIGKTRSHLAAESLVEGGARALLSWGCAGGLVSTLRSGSVILPKNVIGADQTIYHADQKWHECLWSRLTSHLDVHDGLLVEGSTILADPEEKQALFERTGAIAVDMESASIASAAHDAGVPFLAIRAIADPVGQTIPRAIQSGVDGLGRLSFLKVIGELAKRPRGLLGMIRLGLSFRAAQASLAVVSRLTDSGFCLF